MPNKVIGIGETVLDIVFGPDNQPRCANPGGSAFNAMISIGRSGHRGTFISEVGDDRVGAIIRTFLTDNGIDASCVATFPGSKSHLSLAFLDENRNAQYTFYKDYKAQRVLFDMPPVARGDMMLFGSFFALNPQLRPDVLPVLQAGRSGGALLYYDINFRQSHAHEREELRPVIFENFRLSHIVKGSDEDIEVMFGSRDWRAVYRDIIRPLCPVFICTQGAAGATLLTPGGEWHVPAQKLTPVSTIGAGDNFNAGVLCSLLDQGFAACDIEADPAAHAVVDALTTAMAGGVRFSSEVCQSLDNYIAKR